MPLFEVLYMLSTLFYWLFHRHKWKSIGEITTTEGTVYTSRCISCKKIEIRWIGE